LYSDFNCTKTEKIFMTINIGDLDTNRFASTKGSLIVDITDAEVLDISGGGGHGHGHAYGHDKGGGYGGSGGDDEDIFFSRGPGNSRELFYTDGDSDGDDGIFFSRGPGNSRELFYTP
jgi:hypothetical protein